MTTRTLTVEPREGHFTTREDWRLRELPGLLRRYAPCCAAPTPVRQRLRLVQRRHRRLLRRLLPAHPRPVDDHLAGRLLRGGVRDPRRQGQRGRARRRDRRHRVQRLAATTSTSTSATILQDVLDEAVPRSRHPVILKLSPDYDYLRNAAPGRARRGGRRSPRSTRSRRCGSTPHRHAVAHEPLRRALRPGDQADRRCGSWPSCATPASRCRSSPPAASAPSTTAGSTSGRAPTPSASAARPGSRRYPGYALAPLRGLAVRRLLRTVGGHDPRPTPSAASRGRVTDGMIAPRIGAPRP